MRPRRTRRRVTIPFERLLEADDGLRRTDAKWIADGYQRASARLWRCKDGSFTARVVWRNRAETISTIVYTIQGIR